MTSRARRRPERGSSGTLACCAWASPGDAGVTKAFADGVAKQFGHYGWEVLLGVGLLVYFYAHYAFASITAHVVSMFPPFLAVLLMQGGPPGIIVYTFAILANLAAGLTHFGTTPGPIFCARLHDAEGVVEGGLIISFVNWPSGPRSASRGGR
jgi:DASS family divalent anion:Na+ symporter